MPRACTAEDTPPLPSTTNTVIQWLILSGLLVLVAWKLWRWLVSLFHQLVETAFSSAAYVTGSSSLSTQDFAGFGSTAGSADHLARRPLLTADEVRYHCDPEFQAMVEPR